MANTVQLRFTTALLVRCDQVAQSLYLLLVAARVDLSLTGAGWGLHGEYSMSSPSVAAPSRPVAESPPLVDGAPLPRSSWEHQIVTFVVTVGGPVGAWQVFITEQTWGAGGPWQWEW